MNVSRDELYASAQWAKTIHAVDSIDALTHTTSAETAAESPHPNNLDVTISPALAERTSSPHNSNGVAKDHTYERLNAQLQQEQAQSYARSDTLLSGDVDESTTERRGPRVEYTAEHGPKYREVAREHFFALDLGCFGAPKRMPYVRTVPLFTWIAFLLLVGYGIFLLVTYIQHKEQYDHEQIYTAATCTIVQAHFLATPSVCNLTLEYALIEMPTTIMRTRGGPMRFSDRQCALLRESSNYQDSTIHTHTTDAKHDIVTSSSSLIKSAANTLKRRRDDSAPVPTRLWQISTCIPEQQRVPCWVHAFLTASAPSTTVDTVFSTKSEHATIGTSLFERVTHLLGAWNTTQRTVDAAVELVRFAVVSKLQLQFALISLIIVTGLGLLTLSLALWLSCNYVYYLRVRRRAMRHVAAVQLD